MKNISKKIVGSILFLSLTIVLFLSSCKNESKNIGTIKLEGTTMGVSDPNFVIRKIICQHDSIIYMESMMKDTLINAYLIKEDSLILLHRFLKRGSGPYEMTWLTSLFDKESGNLSFFENNGALTKGYMINLNKENSIQDKSSWKILDFIKIKNYRSAQSFVQISDTLLLAMGGKYHSREIISIINLNDMQDVIPLEFWPNDGFDQNNLVKQAVYMDNAKLAKNNTLKKYLYVAGEGKYVEIFEITEDNKITGRKIIYESYPKYEVRADNMNKKMSEDMVHHGFYVCATDSFIYIRPVEHTYDQLRSGQSYKGYGLNYNEMIEVFDWNGNLLKKYELDIPFYSFIVDEKDRIIYVETDDLETGDSIIRKYNMN